MTNEEMIKAIKSNYPTSNYTMLREALDKSIELLEEDAKELPEYDQEEAIDFISSRLFGEDARRNTVKVKEGKTVLKTILDLEEEYMRSKGIIED